MPNLYDYRIFISHAWSYGNDYAHLVSILDNAHLFSYFNYSAPREKPLFPPGTPNTSYDIARKKNNKKQNKKKKQKLVLFHADSSGFRPISKIMQLKWLTGTQLPLFQLFVAMCDSL